MTEAAAPSSDAPVDIVDMTDVEEPELTYKEKVEKAKAEIEAKKAAAKAAAEEKAAAEAAAKAELDEIEAKKHAEIAEKLRIENAEKAEADAKRHAELYGDLAAGQIVRLGGLKARPELNGLTAEIESFVFDTGRVNVKVEPTAIHQQGEVLALKPAALEPLSADEEAKAKAMVVEKLGERSVRVECAGTMLKLTLTPKMLQKPFREAVVAPFLKAFSKKRNEARVLTPDDVYQVTIDSDGQKKLKVVDDIYIYSAADALKGCVGEVDIDVYLKRDRPPPPPKPESPKRDKSAVDDGEPKRTEKLPEGARVEIYGLTSAAGAQLNGLHGHIEKWHENKGRYDVKIEGEADRIVSAKAANVRMVGHTPSGRRVG